MQDACRESEMLSHVPDVPVRPELDISPVIWQACVSVCFDLCYPSLQVLDSLLVMKEACVTVHIVHTSDVDNHMLDAIHTLGVEIHSSDVIPYARRRFYELGFRV